jgi:hypothetical protein
MSRISTWAALAVACLALAACSSADKYAYPDLTPQAAATVTGTRYQIADAGVPDTRVYLTKLDGAFTLRTNSWDGRTLILPGSHLLEFGVSQKNMSAESWGFGRIQATLEAGKFYYLRAKPIETVVRNCFVTQAWLEADGAPVSPPIPVMLARFNGMEMPLAGGGFATLPSTNACPSN